MSGTTSSVRPGLVLADSQYRSDASGYLQVRLRIFYAVIIGLALVLYVVGGVLQVSLLGWDASVFTAPDRIVHLVAMIVAGAILVTLVRRRCAPRTLFLLDAVGLYIPLAAAISVYAIRYDQALHSVPAFLGLIIVGRSVVVPCSATGTLLLSLPAPIALATVQLVFGTSYGLPGVRYPDAQFGATVVWNLVVLLAACGIATVSAAVSFGLREQVRRMQRLGQYHLEESIGRGSMGEVYRATHAMLRRPTAVKLLHPEIAGAETIGRFEREVRETSRLTHPNTIRIYDFGRTPEGAFYYAMELLDGVDLQQVVTHAGPLPPARAIHILEQACAALHEAHDTGLIHRDIKPGNIMLCRRAGEHDVVKVVDFGLVKDLRDADSSLTQLGTICGTPETLAPEVVTGGSATPASDLYSLGCVAYFLLTGRPVFDAKSALDFLSRHMNETPVPPRTRRASVPADLDAVVLRCLAKEPGDRYAGASELRAALQQCRDARLWTEGEAAEWWAAFRSPVAV